MSKTIGRTIKNADGKKLGNLRLDIADNLSEQERYELRMGLYDAIVEIYNTYYPDYAELRERILGI